jgi:hypothetical protein
VEELGRGEEMAKAVTELTKMPALPSFWDETEGDYIPTIEY